MPDDPRLRASDADREATARRLQDAHAEGRITADELTERLDRTYAARTLGDLEEITSDLPVTPRAVAPTEPAPPATQPDARATPATRGDGGLRQQWAAWAGTSLVLIVIWGVSSFSAGRLLYFWPIWVIGIWGAAMLARTLFGGDRA